MRNAIKKLATELNERQVACNETTVRRMLKNGSVSTSDLMRYLTDPERNRKCGKASYDPKDAGFLLNDAIQEAKLETPIAIPA